MTGIDSLWTAIGGALAVLAATPIAISVARRTDFLDHPVGYKKHDAPTPYLGGAAVMASVAIAWLVAWIPGSGLATLFLCALGAGVIGTIDDRMPVAPKWRLLAGVAIAVIFYKRGLGWHEFGASALDCALTIVWVVGLVTAFNLMDNLDGATGTVSGVSAAGIGALALSFNAYAVAAAAFALAGACAGYLRFNLARPRARIFLGDGGSMPLGLLLAGLSIAALKPAHIHGSALFAGAMLVGLPIVDVALVSISRWRRGVTLTTGGRDHLTHRILPRAGSPRRVAAVLALLQAALAGLGILGAHLGVGGTSVIAAALAIGGLVAIGVLDGPRWRPAGVASATRPGDGELHSSVLAAQGAESQ